MRKDPVRTSYARRQACTRIEISAEGGQCWCEGVLSLDNPDTAGRGFTVPGRSLMRDHTQTWESRMAAVAVSSVTLDQCFDIWEGHSQSATIRVGPGVQPLQGVKHTYSSVLRYVRLSIRLH